MSAQPKVTIPRVESWLTSNELDYELDSDSSILTGFGNCSINIIDFEHNLLVVFSTWRGEFAAGTETALADYINEHNSSTYAPHAAFFTSDGVARLRGDMIAFTTEGMSDAQLDGFLDSAFTTILSFYDAVEKDFPDLVTWSEED